MSKTVIPDTYKDVIITFIKDLNTTFPEYEFLWKKWVEPTEPELEELFHFMMKVFPERMFDILTENEQIFDKQSNINTVFLPNVEFKLLFNVPDITDTTKKTIWKYLQLIMMTIMSSIKSKKEFGETANIFEGIDESFLQEKINESIEKMSDFFDNIKASAESSMETDNENPDAGASGGEELPNPEKLFEHLQGIFNGKIGSLAKEFAEEFSGEMKDILNEDDLKNATSVKDVLPKLLKDPKKIMSLVNNIHQKVNRKMETGELSREDLMKETKEMMDKMKEMGGVDQFADMLKGMAGQMGMGGKNFRIDKNALKKMESQMKQREQLRKKMEQRKENVVKNNQTGQFDFIDGNEKQEQSLLEQKEEIDRLMKDFEDVDVKTKNNTTTTSNNNVPKKNTKSGKKSKK